MSVRGLVRGARARRVSPVPSTPAVRRGHDRLRRAAVEALEGRQLFAAVPVAGTAGNDLLVVTALTADSGTYQLNGGAVTPFAAATSFSFTGAGGDDVLRIVNPAGGLFAPTGGIAYDGGGQPGDALENVGGLAATGGSYTAGATPDAGTLVNVNGATTQTINFTGLAPVTDTVPSAAFTVNATAAGEVVNVVNGPVVGVQTTQVNGGAAPTFELVNFGNKTAVTVNALGGADTVGVNVTTPAAGLTTLTVDTGGNAGDVLNVSAVTVPTAVNLRNAAGPVVDANGAATNVSATSLTVLAGTGVGPGDALETAVTNLEAETTTGGIAIANTGNLTVGGLSASLRGLFVGTSGDIDLVNAGSITLVDTDGVESARGGSTSGNVSLTANGAASNITSTVNRDAISAPGGNITLVAGQDVSFGTTGSDFDNDVRVRGALTITAGRDVVFDGFSDAASDDFGGATGAALTFTAGRDIRIDDNAGVDASAGASGSAGADVLLTTGVGGTLVLEANSPQAVFSQSGDVTVVADRVAIQSDSGITANNGSVTFLPRSAARPIDVGSATDIGAAVELSDAELDRVSTPLLIVNGTASASAVNVTAPITGTTYATLSLRSSGNLAGPGTVTVNTLELVDGSAVARTYAIAPGTVTQGANPTLNYVTPNLRVIGGSGNTTFNVTPSATTTITVDGAAPAGPGSAPGDALTVNTAGTTAALLAVTAVNGDSKDGAFTFGNRQPVNFTSIESLAPSTIDLGITKTDGVATEIPGTTATYTIVVTNTGAIGVAGVTVTDLFPAALTGVTYTSVAAGGATGNTAAGVGNINDVVTVPVGGTITYTATGTINPSATGSLSNTATVTGPANITDTNPANNSATDTDTLTPQADVSVTKTGAATVLNGTNLAYTVTVVNTGPSDAANVVLSDVLPPQLNYVSAIQNNGPAFVINAVAGTVTATPVGGTLAAGASAQFTITVAVPLDAAYGDVFTNTATVATTTTDTNAANNSSTVNTTDVSVPVITVSDVTKKEGNTAASGFTFNVALSNPSVFPIQVGYGTADVSATLANGDYDQALGTLTYLPGQVNQTVSVLVNGDTTVEPDEVFALNVGPVVGTATVGDGQGLGTIVNDDPVPSNKPGVSVNDVSVTEGNSGTKLLTFTVKLSKSTGSTVTVKYTTADGTATAGSDYNKKSGTLTFSPFQTSKTISVEVRGDTALEADETLLMVLSAPTNAFVSDPVGIGTIRNDDLVAPPPSKPVITVADVSVTEGNSGTKTLTFTVKLSKAYSSAVSVKYTTSDGTAKVADNDYASKSGTLTFDPGVTSRTVSITVKGDTKSEADESFLLALSGAVNATIGDNIGIGTIRNDD